MDIFAAICFCEFYFLAKIIEINLSQKYIGLQYSIMVEPLCTENLFVCQNYLLLYERINYRNDPKFSNR